MPLGWFTPSCGCNLKLNTNFWHNFQFWNHTIILGSILAKKIYISHLCWMKHCWCNNRFSSRILCLLIAMKLPMDYNPCMKIRTTLSNNQLLSHRLFEWLKLIELSMDIWLSRCSPISCLLSTLFHLLQQWMLGMLSNPVTLL